MKVEINWSKRNSNGSYKVKAKKLADAAKELQSKEEWGNFTWSLKYSIDDDAKNYVTKVRLTAGYDIIMPNWPAYKHQTQQVKDSWDEMWRALKNHEDEHLSLYLKDVNRLENELEALSEANKSDVKIKIEDTLKGIPKKQDELDVKTDHGKNQGAVLNLP